MRRTIFTLTHAALAALALLWCEVLDKEELAAGIVDDDRDEVQNLWYAVEEFVRETLIALEIPANEHTQERAAECVYEILRSDEELPLSPENDTTGAIRWVINSFYFKTGEGQSAQGGLKPNEFGIMAEG